MATFCIKDTGPGIPLGDYERIFRPFERLEPSDRKWAPGTGLGLTITKLMTEVLGGEVSVHSEVGQGSAFAIKFYMPETSAPLATSRIDHARITGYDGPRLTIVVADDQESHRDLVAQLLRPLGFLVLAVADGAACLAAVEDFAPDLVLLDINMPGLSGWDVARALRADPTRKVAIVMLSADAARELEGETLRPSHDGHVVKPFIVGDLLDCIAGVLRIAWTFADANEATKPRAPESSTITMPTADLMELAQIGHARGVAALLKQCQAAFPADEAMIARLNAFAADMDFKGMIAFLRQVEREQASVAHEV